MITTNEIKTDSFNFFVPIDESFFEKAAKEQNSDSKYDNMIIEGVASDDHKDTDEEILEPGGFELDRFLKIGFLNYDHRSKDDSKFIIGEPIEAEIKNNKFLVKAKLYKERELARNLYDTMLILKSNNSDRKLGFSIEGKALERDKINPKRITKALITGLAATFNPKNANSFADIVKGKQKNDFENYTDTEIANGGQVEYLVDIFDAAKGLRYIIDKDLKLKVVKSIDTTTAQSVIKEDLEGKKKKSILNIASAVQKGIIPIEMFYKACENYK
jgi:hypothetical protein